MKIDDLFRQLSLGELSNLSLANGGDGTIIEAKRPMLVNYANESLLRLHSRFVLIENSVLIEQMSERTTYPLRRIYAESNTSSTEPHKFIKDTITSPFVVEAFQEDVIRIIRVSDERGCELPINDENQPLSLFTPKPTILQIPSPENEAMLSVTYQARHPKLNPALTGAALLDQEIEIPFTLEGALLAHIAHQVYSNMNGQENLIKSQEYEADFEKVCLEVVQMDTASQTISTTNTRFELRGFV